MANADDYPPPTPIELPLLNSIPDHLVHRFDPIFVAHHNHYQRGRLHTHQIPIEWYRANPAQYTIRYGRAHFPTPHVRITEHHCPVPSGTTIAVRIFERLPSSDTTPPAPRPAYMNFHGGGWVFGDLATDLELCKRLAHHLPPCVVFDVAYRLAPEHRHPTQVSDAWAAFRWMRETKAPELGLDLERLAVGGASAGAHLAAVVALRARDAGVRVACQVLVVPVVDLHVFTREGRLEMGCPYESYREMWETVALPGERMRFFHKALLGEVRPAEYDEDWEVSPIKHPDMSNLAPALIVTAEMDVLRDEGEAYGRRMNEAGSKAEVWRIPGVPHTVAHLDGILEGGKQFNQKALEVLSKAFGVPITP